MKYSGLTHFERDALVDLGDKIDQGLSGIAVIRACERIALTCRDSSFPFLFSGIKKANQEKIDEALVLFNRAACHPLSRVLFDYLQESRVFAPNTVVFQNAHPYDVWVNSPFYTNHLASCVEFFRRFVHTTLHETDLSHPVIVDVGTGNGVLISRFVQELIALKQIKTAHLVLIDPSESMLKAAQGLCEKEISLPLEFTLIQGKIEELALPDIKRIRDAGKISFLNAAASIHHMPSEKKKTLLRFFSTLTPCTTLIDFHSDHDLPERESPDLIFSVATQYGFYLQDVMNGDASDEDKRACNFQFILAEAINILKNSHETRIDYHTPMREWRKLAEESGLAVHESVSLVNHGDRPMTFGMVLKSDKLLVS